MRIPLEVGRAGLAMTSFVFVLAAVILYYGRPAPGSAPFVITVIMLVGTGIFTALLVIILRRSNRDRHGGGRVPEERNNHD